MAIGQIVGQQPVQAGLASSNRSSIRTTNSRWDSF